MKKLIFIINLCCITIFAQAQIDAKVNPIGILFGSPDISAEYLVSDNFGTELTFGLVVGKVVGSGVLGDTKLRKSGYKIRLAGKFYFNPKKGNDKFYAGLYLGPRARNVSGDNINGIDPGYKISGFGVGLLIGNKWVGNNGIVFEIGIGAGRAFGQKITLNDVSNLTTINGFGLDLIGTIALGYRFNGN